MKNTTRFIYTGLGFLLLALSAGCARETSASAPAPKETQAIAAAGDLAPKMLYKLDTPAGLALDKASVSSPASPKNIVKYVTKPETLKFKETVLAIPPGSSAGEIALPIDSTDGAIIYIGHNAKDANEKEAAAKDGELYAPGGKARINIRAPRNTPGALDKATSAVKGAVPRPDKGLSTLKIGEDKPLGTIELDTKSAKGDYVFKYGAIAGKSGVNLEIRLPKSNIEMDVTPSSTTYLYGDEASVAVDLLDGANGITGATLEAELIAPDGSKRGALPVRELGNGKYEVLATKGLTLSSAIGVYNVFLHAKGTSAGVKFDRVGAAAFGFAIPTARITTVSEPRLVKDEAGHIAAFEVDVNLEVASTDRYELSATLISIGADGLERPLSIAESAAGFGEGKQTLTLRFDAGFAKVTKLEGAFEIRGLQLYSQGRNALYQRHQKGLGLTFPAVRSADLLGLATPSPAVDQMIEDGEYDLTK